MTEQDGALAAVRAAIEAHVSVVDAYAFLPHRPHDWWKTPEGFALDAALTALDARIGRLVRVVRADDAVHDHELSTLGRRKSKQDATTHWELLRARREARAALTAEDVAVGALSGSETGGARANNDLVVGDWVRVGPTAKMYRDREGEVVHLTDDRRLATVHFPLVWRDEEATFDASVLVPVARPNDQGRAANARPGASGET